MIEENVIQWLLDKLSGLDSSLRMNGRVFPDKAPKGTGNPCLIYQTLGGENPEVTDSGPVETGTLDLQLRYYAGQRFLATRAREILRQALQNAECETVENLRIDGTGFVNAGDTFEKETEDYGANAILSIHWSTVASNVADEVTGDDD